MTRVEALITWCKRRGNCDRVLPSLHDIFDDTDNKYFNSVLQIVIMFYTLFLKIVPNHSLRKCTHQKN